MFDRVDEERTQHLDAQRRQADFLYQMLVDCAPDHQALQRVRIHIAHSLTRLENVSLPGSFTSSS